MVAEGVKYALAACILDLGLAAIGVWFIGDIFGTSPFDEAVERGNTNI